MQGIAPERIYIGIDPGQHGGIVAISRTQNNKQLLFVTALCSMDKHSIRHWLSHKVSLVGPENTFALMEKLTGFIAGVGEDGNKRNIAAAHTMFTLGVSVGWLEMALDCTRITTIQITAQEWQGLFGIEPRRKKESPRKFKNRLKEKAQQVFPEEKMTLDTCDAYLIARLCQKRNE